RFLFRSVSSATLWKREANLRLDQISRSVWEEDRSGSWILIHRCQQEQRHHLGRGCPDGLFGESQKVCPWNKNDLC
ncbi:hypothetical protein LEMLEM_LOCUS2917, partial [Lemmus lemmus]